MSIIKAMIQDLNKLLEQSSLKYLKGMINYCGRKII